MVTRVSQRPHAAGFSLVAGGSAALGNERGASQSSELEPRQDWTVAIPVYNAIEVARRAVGYLLSSGVEPSRLDIWDDGSTDPLWMDFRSWVTSKGCAYHRNEENLGYTVEVNRALRAGTSRYILMMNSDCIIGRAAVQALVDTAELHPAIAAVGPLSNSAGFQSVRLRAGRRWQDLDDGEVSASIDTLSQHLSWKYGRRPFALPSINGFCVLWRRTAVEELGLFDEVNFTRGYGEEDDLCFRLTAAGWLCALAPWVFAVHVQSQSFAAVERTARKENALLTLERLHGSDFVASVVSHLESHPLLRQIATEPVDG